MKQLSALLESFLLRLAPRERVLVLLAAAAVAMTLFFLLVWEPLAQAHQRRADALQAARALAERLEVIGAEVQRSRRSGGGAQAPDLGTSLLAAVDLSARAGTLSKPPSRIQPEGEREVRVWLEAVSFDSLLRWIGELETRYGIQVQTADIERAERPGLVDARLTLVRP
jgi:general secretion pathway protein M